MQILSERFITHYESVVITGTVLLIRDDIIKKYLLTVAIVKVTIEEISQTLYSSVEFEKSNPTK